MAQNQTSRLLRAWLVTAVTDALFASTLSVFAYGSTVMALWQGVASTLLGADAMNGGMTTAMVGLAMHFGVAFAWTTVFFVLAMGWPALRRVIRTPAGVIGVAAIYGPVIWTVMSFVVIHSLTGRAPTMNGRWLVQLFGHIPFVALPIVAMTARGAEPAPATYR